MYYLFKIASVVIPRLPHRFVRFLANVIGLLAWLIAIRARKQATVNIIHILGTKTLDTPAGRKHLRKTVQSIFKNSARNYLEMFILPSMQPETLLRNLDVEGMEHFEAALAVGKGVIIFTAHLGPFNYMGQWFAIKGYQVTIPVERMQNQRMLDLSLKLRGSQGMQMIPIGGSDAIRSMIKALRNNQIVMIVADRAIQGESIEKPFFGAPARFPVGPVLLAQRTGAILIGAFGRYSSSNRLFGQFVPLSLALTGDDRMNTDKLMCGMIEKMEQFIGAHPEQWEVLSPIWTSDFSPTS